MRILAGGCILALAVMAAGCGRSQQQAGETPGNNGQQVHAQQAAEGQSSNNEVQNRLEALARSIPQVKDAKCVILGKTAIVGITVDPAMERSRVNVIKFSVAEAFRKDPAGINAFVTADMGLGERIRQVREDIRNGKPFSGFAQELGDIIGRVAPQLPRDIQPLDDRRDKDPNANQFQNNNL